MTMQIQESGKEIIILNSESHWLDEQKQRELLIWFRDNKPELLREIFCEEYPEHMEYANYCENKLERGK